MHDRLTFLLLQVRKPEDPMRAQEVQCFAESIGCDPTRIAVCDLIREPPSAATLRRHDMILLGGSGDFSVATGGEWLPAALESMATLYTDERPTFASCWGFQALARALGGEVVTDLERAEVGTLMLQRQPAAREDPVFGILPEEFAAPLGHQDIVDRLPPEAICLVSSDRVANEAYGFPDKPIWATQFHPELSRRRLLERLRTYPTYVAKIVGIPVEEFEAGCVETPDSSRLIRRMVEVVFE